MLLQKHIRFAISGTDAHTFGVVGEVDHAILDSLEVICLAVMIVEHSVFPGGSATPAETSRALVGLELASVVSIFDEELHVLGYMAVDDDWSIVLYVELEVIEVLDRMA